MSARLTAYGLIKRVYTNGTYSNLALDAAFKDSTLSESDKRLAARLFYGVIERRMTLEHIISAYTKKLDIEVAVVLMMGIYQLLYMDNIPDSAAVNESAELVKKVKKASAAGLVNAVLRRFIREGKRIPPVKGGHLAELSVRYSCPEELIKKIMDGYGEENAISLLEASLLPSDTVIRVNPLVTSPEELAKELESRGVTAVIREDDPMCITAEGIKSVEKDEAFLRGCYHVQDYSSQLCCRAADPKSGDTVIDVCAAPGGKTFTMAEMMGDKGVIYACELHEKRTRLIEKGAKRLKLSCVKAVCGDAREHNGELPPADVVLCDVPCSGYGVIRGKPEIRYKPLSEGEGLPKIQGDILENASGYVRPGGTLIYSTCTVNIDENEAVAERFLKAHPEFEGDFFPEDMGEHFKGKFMTAVFPKDFGSDGFFICRMKRKA
ncbi:MAG: 16S rRNA (cytosine(967)-C(5))-methyltransferase RsmB [Huintestinicola sp.]